MHIRRRLRRRLQPHLDGLLIVPHDTEHEFERRHASRPDLSLARRRSFVRRALFPAAGFRDSRRARHFYSVSTLELCAGISDPAPLLARCPPALRGSSVALRSGATLSASPGESLVVPCVIEIVRSSSTQTGG